MICGERRKETEGKMVEPENKTVLHDFTMFLGGVPVMRVDIELTRSGQPAEGPGPVRTMPCECVGGSLTVRNPKRWRCRSRKRFVKLMMSEGVSRNSAEWLASFVRGWKPYGEAWLGHLLRDFGKGDGSYAGRETAYRPGGGEGEKAPVQG